MDAIDAEYWQKCIRHMIKEAKAYLVLDGVIEPEIASVTFVSFFLLLFSRTVHRKCLQVIMGSLQFFPVVGKPCNIYRLWGNHMIITGFPPNL